MAGNREATGEFSVSLTDEERRDLLAWLEDRLRKTLVEEHRTDSSEYRKQVVRNEEIIKSLIGKLSPR